jgi:hypothetical protein
MALTTKGSPMCQGVSVFAAFAQTSPPPPDVSSSPGMRWVLVRAFICAFVALVTLTPTSRGEFIITINENSANVDATGMGSINLAALTFNNTGVGSTQLRGTPAVATLGVPGLSPVDTYTGFTGPSSIGPGMTFNAPTTGVGTTTGISLVTGLILVPQGYQSGSPLTPRSTWANTTISDLGLTPGTYTWTWGSGATADDLTVIIGAPAPEPSSLILAGTALGVVGFCLAIRRWRAAAAAA